MAKKYFTLSFDDGLEQDKKIIEILKERGMKATFNLKGGMFGQRSRLGRIGNVGCMEFPLDSRIRSRLFKNHDHYRIPEDEIRQVYEGFEIASHAYGHEFLAHLPPDKLEESVQKDIQKLSELAGYPIVGHAYPNGSASADVEDCLRRHGIVYARTIKSSHRFDPPRNLLRYDPTCPVLDRGIFDLIDRFAAADPEEDLLFYAWGHGYEMDYGTELCSWEQFQTICDRLTEIPGVIFCTNAEAFRQIGGSADRW